MGNWHISLPIAFFNYMDNGNWIKLNRKLLDNPLMKKPLYGWLWVILLLKANYEDKEFIWNNEKQICKRGQFITGRKQLSIESGISESQIERILNYFELDGQIEQQKTNKFRLILIKNYDKYQEVGQQKDNKRTTKGHNKEYNKNNKNINNIIISESSSQINKVMNEFYEINPGLNFGNKTQRKAVDEMINKWGADNLIGMIRKYREHINEKYMPVATTPLQFKNKIGDIKVGIDRLKNGSIKVLNL